MKLTKTLLAAATLSALSVGSASAMTAAQCTQVGGTVVVATASCELTVAQYEQATSLGFTTAGGAAAAGAGAGAGGGLGAIGGAGAGAAGAAAAGLVLAAVIVGDSSSSTTTSFP